MDKGFFETLDSHSQDWLNSLTVDDCKELKHWITTRIKYLNNRPFVKKKIEDLGLSMRAYNALKTNGLHTIEDIVHFGVENIWMLRNIGSKTVIEIKKAIGQ